MKKKLEKNYYQKLFTIKHKLQLNNNIDFLLILLNNENLSLTFFISGLIGLVISIILFIIEITISSKSLRVHIADVENEDN